MVTHVVRRGVTKCQDEVKTFAKGTMEDGRDGIGTGRQMVLINISLFMGKRIAKSQNA